MNTPRRRLRRLIASGLAVSALAGTALFAGSSAAVADTGLEEGPEPTTHTQEAYAPESDFTAKWTRADARQLDRLSDPATAPRENSMPHRSRCPPFPRTSPTCRTATSGCGTPGP